MKKTAYYLRYDPSRVEMSEYCIRQDMCDDIASLEDSLFVFGQEMVKFSKNLDGLEKQKIVAKIQDIVKKYCEAYIEQDDNIANLDEYDGLEEYDEDEDEW